MRLRQHQSLRAMEHPNIIVNIAIICERKTRDVQIIPRDPHSSRYHRVLEDAMKIHACCRLHGVFDAENAHKRGNIYGVPMTERVSLNSAGQNMMDSFASTERGSMANQRMVVHRLCLNDRQKK
jgi:hypothetical protein